MTHFANIENNIVVNVIVADKEFIEQLKKNNNSTWVETTYEEPIEGSLMPTGNYAGIGYTYNPDKNIFIPPKPYASWILDEAKNMWVAPKPAPTPEHRWNESTLEWEVSLTDVMQIDPTVV